MRTIDKEMMLGFSQENETYTVYVKQGDSQRKIQFELIDENDDYIINDVTAIYFRERFADNTSIVPIQVYPIDGNNETLTSGSILTVQLTEEMTDVPGMAYCELMFVKTDGVFDINPDTEEIIGNFDILTTQTFNLYIEPNVSGSTKIHSQTSTDILLKLVLATQALNNKVTAFEEGGTYTDETGVHTITYDDSRQGQEVIRARNEQTRIINENNRNTTETTRQTDETTRQTNETTRQTNENTRQSNETTRQTNETERQRVEQKRKAFEGEGNYALHPASMSYEDDQGTTRSVLYQDSRVGASERDRALTYGGTYVDTDGTQKTASNTYTDYSGQTHDASSSDLNSKSLIAVAASTLKAAQDNYGFTRDAHDSAVDAATSATNANASSTSASNSATSATQSKSDAEAFANGTRDGQSIPSTDPAYHKSAKYWAEQAQDIAQSFAGTLRPKGTVAPGCIIDPTDPNYINVATASAGDMYNISDEFVTTSDFVEGAGHKVPLGANIYVTSDHKWDVLAGSPVTGVKGDAEANYRTGNVNITKSDIGLNNVTNNKTTYSNTEPTGGVVGDMWIGPI